MNDDCTKWSLSLYFSKGKRYLPALVRARVTSAGRVTKIKLRTSAKVPGTWVWSWASCGDAATAWRQLKARICRPKALRGKMKHWSHCCQVPAPPGRLATPVQAAALSVNMHPSLLSFSFPWWPERVIDEGRGCHLASFLHKAALCPPLPLRS